MQQVLTALSSFFEWGLSGSLFGTGGTKLSPVFSRLNASRLPSPSCSCTDEICHRIGRNGVEEALRDATEIQGRKKANAG